MARNQPVVSGRSVHASVSLWLCASVHVYESTCDYDCVHVCARTCIHVSVWQGSDARRAQGELEGTDGDDRTGSELHHTRDRSGASMRGPSRVPESRVRPLRACTLLCDILVMAAAAWYRHVWTQKRKRNIS